MEIQLNKCSLYNIIISISLLVYIGSEIGYAQESKPITKENIVAALKDCNNRRFCTKCRRCTLKASDFIQEIKKHKVDFNVCYSEQEIREAGNFLKEKEIGQLINVLRNSYIEKPCITSSGELCTLSLESISRRGKLTVVDSSGDDTIDEKIRIIHSALNNILRLDTSYKFYDNEEINSFSISLGDKDHLDGTLFIGRHFIKKYIIIDAKNSQLASDAKLYFLIARLMSTIKQDKVKCFFPYNLRNLHADFLAGWQVSQFLRILQNNSPEYLDAFFNLIKLFFHLGKDANPAYPSIGTPKERLDAVSAGFRLQNETDSDKAFQKGIEYMQRSFQNKEYEICCLNQLH